MRITHAIAAAASAFKSAITPGTGTVGYGYSSSDWAGIGPNAYLWDAITNGWAAVSGAWGAFWSTLREWGGTSYTALAASAAANPHAGRGLRLICDNGAAVPVVAYRGDDEAPEIPALAAIERTGWDEMFTAFVWGVYCGGEVFFLRTAPRTGPNAGQVRRLAVLRNERFLRVEVDGLGDPLRYVFQAPGSAQSQTYAAADVLHVRLFNPSDPDRGLPILISARRALTMVEEADAWNRGIAKGGGRVPGYFKPSESMLKMFQGQIPAEKVREAQAQTDLATRERQHVNLPQILSGAFDFEQGGVSPREADWLKGRQTAMREIAAVLGVPATLLADEKGGSLTDAGVDSEVAALYKLTIQPLVARLLRELTAWLCADGERLDADWDQVPALQEDMDAKFVRYQGAVQASLLSKKEGRVAIGYEPEVPAELADEAPDVPAPPVPPQPDETTDDETTKALGGLSGDGFAALLSLIPTATA